MAIKRFDDIDKKARELEAQAKKLRREKQAAKTKAYADALVAVFPEVKEMGSAEEVPRSSRHCAGTQDMETAEILPMVTRTQSCATLRATPILRTAAAVLSAARGSVPSAVPSIKTRRRFGHEESSPCPTFGRVVLSDRTC